MPLSDRLKDKLANGEYPHYDDSADLRQRAKHNAERAGKKGPSKISNVGKNIYHAELLERGVHDSDDPRQSPFFDGHPAKYAFR